MSKNINILSLRKLIVCLVISTGITAISYAGVSYGGGGDKPKASIAADFALSPFKANHGFTLKAGPSYKGSSFFDEARPTSLLTVNSVVTYQKGNTTYIMPYKHKVSFTAAKSNLQAVNLKITIKH